MNVYYCNDFRGHWPVGSAAIVAAHHKQEAADLLMAQLIKRGLEQEVKPEQMVPFYIDTPRALVLLDGDY